MSPQHYSDEELREDLRAVADQLGRAPSKPVYNDLGIASATTVRQRFNGWASALESAGLEPRSHCEGGRPFHGSKFADLVGSASADDAGGEQA